MSIFEALRAIGVGAVEATVDQKDSLPHLRAPEGATFSVHDAAEMGELKRRLAAEGLRISALLVATDFSGPEAARHVDWAVRAVRAARELGAAVVRIDSFTANKSLSPAQVRDNLIRSLRDVLRRTGDTGVDLAVENHGPLSNDERFLDELLAAVPDDRLGLTLDTGNFYWFGYPLNDVYRLIRKYAPRAKHTHMKNINFPPELAEQRREIGLGYKQYCCPLDEGNLDVRRIVSSLRTAGYRRDLCIEDESLFKVDVDKRLDVLRREAAALRLASGNDQAR